MKNKLLLIFCLFSAVIFIRAKCAAAPEDGDGGKVVNSVEDMKLSDGDISGWSEESGSYSVYNDGTELFEIINGGAVTYTSKGMIKGIHQIMKGSSYEQVEIFIMDFEDSEKTTAAYESIVSTKVNSEASISDYSTDVVTGDVSISGGINVYAHFDKYYFELKITGYTDEQIAKGDAELFISVYDSWLN